MQDLAQFVAGAGLDEYLSAGWCVGSRFVYSQHCKSCRTVGLSEEQIAAIPNWESAACFDLPQRAVLAYTDCLSAQNGQVPDEVFDALSEHLTDEEILELTYIVATYGMHGVISRALRLEFDADESQPLIEVPGDHTSLGTDYTQDRLRVVLRGGDQDAS